MTTDNPLPDNSSHVAAGDTAPAGADRSAVAEPGQIAAGDHDDLLEAPTSSHTRLSGYWAAIGTGLVVLLVLIVFILENTQRVKVSFFGAHARLGEGVALLLSAVIGGLVVVFAGTARILQLRSRARRREKAVGARGRRRKR